ncbi:MAG: sensor histidine kinase, partial [Rhodobacterales bacterium]
SDVDLTIDVPDQPVTVLGDAAQLQQVFTNLIENAIKYGAKGNKVVVTVVPHRLMTRLQAQGTMITVLDFGDGIAPHHITRLTERFYRVDSHRSREVGGTGLGLAIVKHIVNRHRGRLAVTSVLGQGTTVTVTLPKD